MSACRQSNHDLLMGCAQLQSYLLVTGYLRELITMENIAQYEKSLSKIIMQSLGNIFVKFDVYPQDCAHLICDDGKCLKRNKDDKCKGFCIGSSYGWYGGVQQISFETRSNCWFNAGYGITSNLEAFKCAKSKWVGDVKTGYHYGLFYGHIAGLEDGYQDRVTMQKFAVALAELEGYQRQRCGVGEVHKDDDDENVDVNKITLRFDGNDWTVTWFLNDTIVGKPVEIMECCTYYPFLFFQFTPQCGNEEYRIL